MLNWIVSCSRIASISLNQAVLFALFARAHLALCAAASLFRAVAREAAVSQRLSFVTAYALPSRTMSTGLYGPIHADDRPQEHRQEIC